MWSDSVLPLTEMRAESWRWWTDSLTRVDSLRRFWHWIFQDNELEIWQALTYYLVLLWMALAVITNHVVHTLETEIIINNDDYFQLLNLISSFTCRLSNMMFSGVRYCLISLLGHLRSDYGLGMTTSPRFHSKLLIGAHLKSPCQEQEKVSLASFFSVFGHVFYLLNCLEDYSLLVERWPKPYLNKVQKQFRSFQQQWRTVFANLGFAQLPQKDANIWQTLC